MKSTKVFYMGKRLKDIYPHATGWEVFKYKVHRFFEKVFLVGVVLGVIAGISAIVRYAYPVYQIQVQEKEVILDNLAVKIDQLKGELIKDIHDIERGGKSEEDALITFDPNPNNKKVEIASIGTCQFKISTVVYYEQKLHNRNISRKDAVLLALDDQKCLALMNEIIFKEQEGWANWYNSGVKVNAKSRLAVIRELEK